MGSIVAEDSLDFFLEMIETAWQKQGHKDHYPVKLYLAQLLRRFSKPNEEISDLLYHRAIAPAFLENLKKISAESIYQYLNLGDAALFMASFGSFARVRQVTAAYYLAFSQTSFGYVADYGSRYGISSGMVAICSEFASDVRPFAKVLREVFVINICPAAIKEILDHYWKTRSAEDSRLLEQLGNLIPPMRKLIIY